MGTGSGSVGSSYYDGLIFLSGSSSAQDFRLISEHENCTFGDLNILGDLQLNPSTSQDDSKSRPDSTIKLPKNEDMLYWILAAFVLILVRRFVERNIFLPIGQRLGITDRANLSIDKIPCRIRSAILILDNAYSSNKKISDLQLRELSKGTGLTPREVQRWMRRRRAVDRPSTLVKFSESGWRFVTYVTSTAIGIATLWNKPWAWDFEKCWEGYPNQELSDEVWWYYLCGAGLYISFLLTQFFDVKRKDFWEMFVHHIVTIGLLTISYHFNLTRLGAITLLLHDCADIFIESAKMANYAKKEGLSTGIFVAFTLVWIVTRLGIFPSKVIYQVWQRGPDFASTQVINTCVGMLLTLFGLHLFWTYFICKVAIAAVKSGPEKQKDARSSSESSSSSDSSSELKEQEALQEEEEAAKARHRDRSRRLSKRPSLQSDSYANSPFLARQRAIMKRISSEIM